ncbi:hypothetical protein YOLOSWAG_22 [Erwinia phage vB_EamM_Yoloswag]|uniref:Uncharacterized protein n=1 Tax=Erwinia phage vB_EamM_Yoloswag TaxID=1958956 RepID=A0A1S6L2X3_9CAUD|nr:hypothetical protein HOR66_gp022 [Erwinia phage vB_EamM_Yoloswag]AQT28509.1 hypothetical protein YOLOSWAG_22 [Erwinia phage vB_EamM_Yoloswag]
MTEKTVTTKWVPVIDIKISGDEGPAMNALYVQIHQALEDAGVFVEHAKPELWEEIQATGEQHLALGVLDEISPHVILSQSVTR